MLADPVCWHPGKRPKMQFGHLKRRECILLLGGAATWPLAAHAQQSEQMRRIGVIMSLAENDPEDQARVAALQQGLAQFGWTDGRNVRIEYRWGAGDPNRYRKYAAELVALAADVILATGDATGPVEQATRTIPVVFVLISDPVSAGYVASLSRPGGNATGFSYVEYGSSAKWLELLKQIAPGVTRVAVLRDPSNPTGIGQLGAVQSVAPSFGVEVTPLGVRDSGEIERAVTEFARRPNGGLIVTPTSLTIIHRKLIVALAGAQRLPAVYGFAVAGGLISYAPDIVDQYRRAAEYIDRILKGEKPADLPVQNPTKFKLAVNRRTAKALGLTVPDTLLVSADEVIE
jgi:putative tryptophan/tyrosine transport system substrate-binding protein